MSDAPRVSVVIPAYNAAGFLDATLDSVRAQTWRDYEVIVVDDGSADATLAVAESALRRHGLRGRCLRQSNLKIAGARNTGMRAAGGDLIALLDHDDLWKPRKLERVVAEFDRHPRAVLVGHDIAMTKNGRVARIFRKGPAVPWMYEWLLFMGNSVGTSAAVFRRAEALEIGGFREDPELMTVEDYDFWMRLSRVGSFRFIPEVLAEYPVLETSASRRVAYHHRNLEGLVRRHFSEYFGPSPGGLARGLMRFRLGGVHRAAVSQSLEARADPVETARFVGEMLRSFPLDPRSLIRAAQWAWRRALRPLDGKW